MAPPPPPSAVSQVIRQLRVEWLVCFENVPNGELDSVSLCGV